jgi:putative nucleotidyltransferase with HDIG domain
MSKNEIVVNKQDLLKVRLGALLHDIGKPLCWALKKSWSNHVEFGFDILKYTFGEEIAKTAVSHHTTNSYHKYFHPSNKMERAISIADHISAGADRNKDEDPSYGGAIPSLPILMTHPLSTTKENILYRMDANELISFTENFKQKFRKAVLDEKIFNDVYKYLSDSILKKIPADTRFPYNDVSLFDHLRLASAIANCLWSQQYINTDPSSYNFSIICADADRISSLILKSSRLPDLRASSLMVSQSITKTADIIRNNVGPECMVFEGGGGFIAISDPKFSSSLTAQIKRTFNEITNNDITISVATIKVNGNEIKNEFTTVGGKAIKEMHDRKLNREYISMPILEEGKSLCNICRLRPSTHKLERPLLVNTLPSFEDICDTCITRREHGKSGGISTAHIKDNNNLIAILKMDGDDMGEIISGDRLTKTEKKHPTPSRIATISRLVHEACEERLNEIIQNHGGLTIYIGGDDVLAILPANKVFKAAIKMQEAFSNIIGGGSKCGSGSASMSAGIAILNYKIPIYAGLEAANDHLKIAKINEGKSSVSFGFLFGISGPSLLSRNNHNINSSNKEEQIKKNIYKWSKFERLVDIVDYMVMVSLKDGGSSQIRSIAEKARHTIHSNSSTMVTKNIEAEMLIKYYIGRKVLAWKEGHQLLDYLKNGNLVDAFIIYNLFKDKI